MDVYGIRDEIALKALDSRVLVQQTGTPINYKYIGCYSILGSRAEVERLWSIAKYVLAENCQSMTPELLDALLFLKLNMRLCDACLVSESYKVFRNKQ